MPRPGLIATAMALAIGSLSPALAQVPDAPVSRPIVIGQSYTLPSAIMDEPREINVWLPPGYADSGQRYPVLYILDGGIDQDFHHISGLAQLGTIAGTTRDIIVIGITSRDRRNELALRSEDPELIAAYPTQGQSARFRRHLTEEALPFVEATFRTDGEAVLMGESLAGLFVVETFLKQPALFDDYVAISPSLWWDDGELATQAATLLAAHPAGPRKLILTIADEGGEMQTAMDALVAGLTTAAPADLVWTYEPRPHQTHATIYHGAAMEALRTLFPVPATEPATAP
ncbi:alpha/beta hydrolase [Brevundimonas variabilis]|uniref:Esterase n=1 Tax=Brevundimonas variabilis TaxID=74312 RepID=A0A7W9CJN4_9CAUL|nr:alpha/beta hydrolase-fold protein [Brevundimonas variabilis]MBB5746910.1 hypothetical protein [Brevundimonas variabilis]